MPLFCGIYCVTEMVWNCQTSGVLYVRRRRVKEQRVERLR